MIQDQIMEINKNNENASDSLDRLFAALKGSNKPIKKAENRVDDRKLIKTEEVNDRGKSEVISYDDDANDEYDNSDEELIEFAQKLPNNIDRYLYDREIKQTLTTLAMRIKDIENDENEFYDKIALDAQNSERSSLIIEPNDSASNVDESLGKDQNDERNFKIIEPDDQKPDDQKGKDHKNERNYVKEKTCDESLKDGMISEALADVENKLKSVHSKRSLKKIIRRVFDAETSHSEPVVAVDQDSVLPNHRAFINLATNPSTMPYLYRNPGI